MGTISWRGEATTRGSGDESATGITQISVRNHFIDLYIHCVDLLWEVFNEGHVSFIWLKYVEILIEESESFAYVSHAAGGQVCINLNRYKSTDISWILSWHESLITDTWAHFIDKSQGISQACNEGWHFATLCLLSNAAWSVTKSSKHIAHQTGKQEQQPHGEGVAKCYTLLPRSGIMAGRATLR